MGKINIVNRNGRSLPECTQCEHRFETEYAKNDYYVRKDDEGK